MGSRTLVLYLAAGVTVTGLVVVFDGERGLHGSAAAWLVCLAPLVRWRHRRVADGVAGSTIADKWGMLQTGRMLFRLTWVLGVGAILYQRFGDRLGVGFWIALIVLYQVMLALSVIGVLADTSPASGTATDGVSTSDDSGGRL